MNFEQYIVKIENMDSSVINEIKNKYDLTKDEDILALYAALESGKIQLKTPQERAFDDKIYDLAMAARSRQIQGRKQPASQRGNNPERKKPVRGKRKLSDRKRIIVLTRGELRMKRFVTSLLLLVATGCLVYFGVYCYDAYRIRQENERLASRKENELLSSIYKEQSVTYTDDETGSQKTLTILDEYKSLYNQNKNLIGWLKISDTNIDYPVLQTDDNEFYLDHDINDKQDKNGALFMDYACDIVRPSSNYIIYGHNMRSGNMFGNLDKYKSSTYYKEHPTIQFDTIYEKGIYQVMYVFHSHVFTEDEIAFKYYQMIDIASEREFDSNMNSMKEMTLYDTGVTAAYGDQLLTLSTCDYAEEDGRFVVVAKRIQ